MGKVMDRELVVSVELTADMDVFVVLVKVRCGVKL